MPDSCANALAPTIALFGWTGKAGDAGHELRRGDDLRRIDARRAREHILARAHGHDDFLERRIAGALAEAIDRAFDLPRAVHHRRQRVRDGETEIVVAMDGPHGAIGIRNPLAQRFDQRAELPRHRVADGVGNVDRRRTRGDRRLQQPAQEVGLGAPRILRRELDVVRVFARPADCLDRLLEHLVGRHPQLHLHVDRRARDERVDAHRLRGSQRVTGATDVVLVRTGERAHGAVADGLGNVVHRFEIAVRRRREIPPRSRRRAAARAAARCASSLPWSSTRRGSARHRATSCRR